MALRPGWRHLSQSAQPHEFWLTTPLGQPGFFKPHDLNPWFSPAGARTATSYYDTTPLRETLLELVDFI